MPSAQDYLNFIRRSRGVDNDADSPAEFDEDHADRQRRATFRQRASTAGEELERLRQEKRDIPYFGERTGVGEDLTGGFAQLFAPFTPKAETEGKVAPPPESGLSRSVAQLWGGERAAAGIPRSTREALTDPLFGGPTVREQLEAREATLRDAPRVFTPEGMSPEEQEEVQQAARFEREARAEKLAEPEVFGEAVEGATRPLRAAAEALLLRRLHGGGVTAPATRRVSGALAGALRGATTGGAAIAGGHIDPEARITAGFSGDSLSLLT